MQASPRKCLRAELAQKLHPDALAAYKDIHLDKLIDNGWINLTILASASAADLSNVGLPIALVRVLQVAGLVGKHHHQTPSGQPWAVRSAWIVKVGWGGVGWGAAAGPLHGTRLRAPQVLRLPRGRSTAHARPCVLGVMGLALAHVWCMRPVDGRTQRMYANGWSIPSSALRRHVQVTALCLAGLSIYANGWFPGLCPGP